MVSAALASMCCILPLSLGTRGLSATVVAAFFEPLKPWFLALAALLLGIGFNLAFRCPPEGEVCSPNSRALSKISKPAVRVSTIAIVALVITRLSQGNAASPLASYSLHHRLSGFALMPSSPATWLFVTPG